jgi:hypothetical protein
MVAKTIAALTCLIIAATSSLHAQQSTAQARASQRRQRVLARDQWQMRGRSIRGTSTAALRQRAIRQKIKMRAAPRVTQSAA